MSAALIQPGKRQAPVRCAIYLRITRDDQKTGFGVDRQLTKAEAMAAVLGWSVVLIVDENDTSASNNSKPRPKYQDLLAKIRNSEVDAVIGYDNTRLTRQPREAEDILDLADSTGVRVALVVSGREVNFSDPTDRHQFRNATANAALEIELNSLRSKAEREQRALAGGRQGLTPFGWRRAVQLSADGSRVIGWSEELHPTEAEEVRQLAARLLAGVSLRELAADLNRRQVPTRRGARWDSTSVRALLQREANVGRRVHRGKVLEGVVAQWPPILDELTHTRVQRLLADPGRKTSHTGGAYRWQLSGIMTCAGCGPDAGRIVCKFRAHSTDRVYYCVSCHQTLSQPSVDDYVNELVAARLANPRLGAPTGEVQAELDELYAAMDAIRAEQGQAGKLVGKGITLAQLVDLNASWDAQLAQLNDRASALLPGLVAQDELPEDWDRLDDVAQRRAVIGRMFASIELVPNRVGRGRRRPFRGAEDIRHVFR